MVPKVHENNIDLGKDGSGFIDLCGCRIGGSSQCDVYFGVAGIYRDGLQVIRIKDLV